VNGKSGVAGKGSSIFASTTLTFVPRAAQTCIR